MSGRTGKWHGEASRQVDQPEEGWFAVRLVKKGWEVPARITREGDLWMTFLDGKAGPPSYDLDIAGVWAIWHRGRRIEQFEYDYLLELKEYMRTANPDHPCLHPGTPIHPMRLTPIPPRRVS